MTGAGTHHEAALVIWLGVEIADFKTCLLKHPRRDLESRLLRCATGEQAPVQLHEPTIFQKALWARSLLIAEGAHDLSPVTTRGASIKEQMVEEHPRLEQ